MATAMPSETVTALNDLAAYIESQLGQDVSEVVIARGELGARVRRGQRDACHPTWAAGGGEATCRSRVTRK